MRVEALDPRHAETIALVRGPLVLFAATEDAPAVTQQQLLQAKQTGPQAWQIETANGIVPMLPFTELGDRPYTTYLKTV